MAYLLHMWYVLRIISGICMACSCYICSKPLWNMRGMSFVYLLCLLAYGRAFLWHIHLTSMACLWPVYGVPLQYLQIVYLWHVYSVCLWYIYGYFLEFSKAQENSKNMLKTSKKHCKTRALTTSHSLIFSPIYSRKYCLIENEYISGLSLSTYIFPNELPNWKRIYKWTFPFHLYIFPKWIDLIENEYISGLSLSTYIFPNEMPNWKRIYKWTFPFHLYIPKWIA